MIGKWVIVVYLAVQAGAVVYHLRMRQRILTGATDRVPSNYGQKPKPLAVASSLTIMVGLSAMVSVLWSPEHGTALWAKRAVLAFLGVQVVAGLTGWLFCKPRRTKAAALVGDILLTVLLFLNVGAVVAVVRWW